MKFCIKLLERKNKIQKYKLPLVCAMAVLGMNKKGWWILKNYLFIMSKMIKIVWFIMIQLIMQFNDDQNTKKKKKKKKK